MPWASFLLQAIKAAGIQSTQSDQKSPQAARGKSQHLAVTATNVFFSFYKVCFCETNNEKFMFNFINTEIRVYIQVLLKACTCLFYLSKSV